MAPLISEYDDAPGDSMYHLYVYGAVPVVTEETVKLLLWPWSTVNREGNTVGVAKAPVGSTVTVATVEFTDAPVSSVTWSMKFHLPVAVEAEVVKLYKAKLALFRSE